ncbi:SDR family oxidoreductase [Streptomyces aurantiogriseus]|uniref:Oxidoreductase n=1 Tax=Streptomyces aurantiogriseus TaxID=66870 RepID=A0A918L0E7_9ACTN|nr:SDR family oxidoreductase [Streptomyces aurantiogriseus]GGR65108.1 oxidoreductase [Streptomyces aurantiogriseus]
MTDIRNKVALITGASSGIGAATALALAEAGAKVGIAARRADRLQALKSQIEEKGGQALVLEMDVADAASVNAGVRKLIDTYGSLDILFNNAGLMPISNIDELKTDEWDRMVDVNIKGVLNATAAVLPQMIEQHSGHILNVGSIAGRKVFGPGFTVYSATKFAVTAFSEGLRMEVGKKHNIRVTSIQPGMVATELAETTSDPAVRQMLHDSQAGIRVVAPSEVADVVLFAAEAPDHVNLAELFILPTAQA